MAGRLEFSEDGDEDPGLFERPRSGTLLFCSKWRKDLSRNTMNNLAPRFGSDLDGTIEKKPRHSPAMLRFFRLRRVQRWPEDRMRYGHVIS